MNGFNHSIRIFILSDDSGYYLIATLQSTTYANLWKFLYSSPTTMTWYEFSVAILTDWISEILNDGSFFFSVVEGSTPNNLWLLRITFGSTTPQWSDKVLCPLSSWSSGRTQSSLSSDGTLIYSFIAYGNTVYTHFVTLYTANGIVSGSRYISNLSAWYVYKVVTLTSHVAASFVWGVYNYISIYNIQTSAFMNFQISIGNAESLLKDSIYGR